MFKRRAMEGRTHLFFQFCYLKNLSRVQIKGSISDDIICSVCGMISSEIRYLTCGHRLCILCCFQVRKPLVCPLDDITTPDSDVIVRRDVDLSISQTKAFCFNHNNGCDYVGSIAEIQGHYSFCGYTAVTCQSCDRQVLHKDIVKHLRQKCNTSLVLADPVEERLQELERAAAEWSLNASKLVSISSTLERIVSTANDSKSSIEGKIHNQKIDLTAGIIHAEKWFKDTSETVQKKVEQLDRKNKALMEQLEDLFNNGTQIENSIAKVEQAVLDVERRSESAVYNWSIFYNQDLRNNLRLNPNFSYVSDDFFSHVQGYKMNLFVKGKTSSKGLLYLAVYMSLQPGPNDDALAWPFGKSFTFRLVNNADVNSNVEQTAVISREELKNRCFARQTEANRSGHGFVRFVKLDELDDDRKGFVKDGKITIQFFVHEQEKPESIASDNTQFTERMKKKQRPHLQM